MTRHAPEKRLERLVLTRLGRDPGILLHPNFVGVCYRPTAIGALREALAPFGHAAVQAGLSALHRARVAVGLGTGSPDIVGACDGLAFGLELKSQDGRVRPEQAAWHAADLRRGMAVEVVRSVEDAERCIRAMRDGR